MAKWGGGLGDEGKTTIIPSNQQSGWANRVQPEKKPASKSKPAAKAASEKQWILKGVQFEVGSDTIMSQSYSPLNEAAGTLKENDRMKVEIQGHTDNTGDAKKNEALSLRRATSVKNYLVQKGISAGRLSVKGYGASKPIASNDSEDGRAQNRRIEFKVLSR